MSISSAMNAGVMGLAVNGVRLAAISDNIANSSTYGFKRTGVDFSSMVLNQQGSLYASGGVRIDTFRDVAALGALISTGGATDLAISGRGMLPVTDTAGVTQPSGERALQLSATGSFLPDQNGHLRTANGMFLLGWPVDAAGEIGAVSRSSGADLEPVNVFASRLTASPTTRVDLGINLPADATLAGSTNEPYDLPIEYYDNLGRSQTATLRFSPIVPAAGASNQWSLEIFDGAGDPAASLGQVDLSFIDAANGSGHIDTAAANGGLTYDPATGLVTAPLAHGPVSFFIGRPGDTSGVTQLSASFSPNAVSKDGAPIGDLQSVEIDERGYLMGVYDTGFRRPLYQIPVADVPNLNGLEALDGPSFAVSAASGNLYLWDAGTGPAGSVQGYALMESTTDIAAELTDLIETQRAYSSNAKIVQTVDEMLQETTNIKR